MCIHEPVNLKNKIPNKARQYRNTNYRSIDLVIVKNRKCLTSLRQSKDRQHNGHKKKDKRTNNDLQNITYKIKDRVTRTPLNYVKFICTFA
jgi:hypothetical protein